MLSADGDVIELDDIAPASQSNGKGEGSSFDPALWAISEGFTSAATSVEGSGLQTAYLDGKSSLL